MPGSTSALEHVPALDISPIYDTPCVETPELLHALVASLSRHGAVRLTGHNMQPCKIRRAFELSKEFFDLPQQLKTSAAVAPCPAGGLSRGYQCLGAGASEAFAVGPPHDTQRPTRWPMGVRGDVLKMTLQAFLRSCLRLHDDLLSILEVALHLRDDELAARWSRQNGEVRLRCDARCGSSPPKSAQQQLEEGEADEDEKDNGPALLTLVFRETAHDEVVLFCGPTVRKWLRTRSRSGVADGSDGEEPTYKDHRCRLPSRYSLCFAGYEDMDTAHEIKFV